MRGALSSDKTQHKQESPRLPGTFGETDQKVSLENWLNIQLFFAEILGAASFSSGPTSDPDPGEPKLGVKDGQLLSQVLG